MFVITVFFLDREKSQKYNHGVFLKKNGHERFYACCQVQRHLCGCFTHLLVIQAIDYIGILKCKNYTMNNKLICYKWFWRVPHGLITKYCIISLLTSLISEQEYSVFNSSKPVEVNMIDHSLPYKITCTLYSMTYKLCMPMHQVMIAPTCRFTCKPKAHD